jgi:hypothetical protein
MFLILYSSHSLFDKFRIVNNNKKIVNNYCEHRTRSLDIHYKGARREGRKTGRERETRLTSN